MKQTAVTLTLFLIVAFVLPACNSEQDKARQAAEQMKSTMKEHAPGSVATSKNEYYMKAKLNGKDWEATHMMPYEVIMSASRIIAYKGDEWIGFPFSVERVKAGEKRDFNESNAADLSFDLDGNSLWGGTKGEVEVTKADDQLIEGRFNFTATSSRSNKAVEVSDGYFRFPRNKSAQGARR